MAKRSPRRALALAALILAAVPSLAQAEVSESTVTSPSNPTFRLYEPERARAEPMLEIEATTDGQNQEKVDVICSYGNEHKALVSDEPVGADGSLEVEVTLGRFPLELCDLRVVPAGYLGPDFSSFTGPVVAASQYTPRAGEVLVRGSDDTAALSYLVAGGHQRAAMAITSAGDGGLLAAVGVKEQAHEPFDYPTWREAAGVLDLMVDGRQAYTTAGIPLFRFGTERETAPAGFEGVRSSVAFDAATGAMAVTESQRIFRCDGTDSEKPEEEDCRTVLDTGIRLERIVGVTREHSITDVRDRWVSTDGRAHQVQVRYSARAQDEKAAADPQWRFPGDAAFRKYDEGDVLVQGPGTALVRDRNALTAPGALSYAPAPLRFSFRDAQTLEEMTLLAVPASGDVPVRRVFATARDVGEAEALGRATEDGFEAPRVTIAGAPARGALATVSGRATDNIGVVALTVGGRPAAVAPDGTFSVPVTLARGANPIVVTATDGAGQSGTAQVVVRRGVARRCRVPKVRAGVRVRAARAALRKAGCRVRTRRVASRTVRKGRVVGLTRRAGRSLPFRAAVGIRVSAGR